MKKIIAKTLEKAYEKAAEEFECSVLDLEYEIVQHPSKGFLGFGAKNAIIVAVCKTTKNSNKQQHDKVAPQETNSKTESRETSHESTVSSTEVHREISDNNEHRSQPESSETVILNGFFDEPSNKSKSAKEPASLPDDQGQATGENKELGREIEERLGELVASTCFDIDTVEADVIDGTAYIFLDGEDAALLIGKEGYRYNALSYLLYNWIHNEYGLFIKLEIAQFLASQQEMIRNYIQPVVDHVYKEGWGKTRPLDGILVQIALEQLREEFPNKYVAIKRTRNGERYILVNEFNKRS